VRADVHPGAEDPSGGVDADCAPDPGPDTGHAEPPQDEGGACGPGSAGPTAAGMPVILALGASLLRRRAGARSRRAS
jgi:hypothetical protein